MKKKLIYSVLTVALALSLFVGCGKKNDTVVTDATEPAIESNTDVEPAKDVADETKSEVIVEELSVKDKFEKKYADNDELIERYENDTYFNWDTAYSDKDYTDFCLVCTITIDDVMNMAASAESIRFSVENTDMNLTLSSENACYRDIEMPLALSIIYAPGTIMFGNPTDFALTEGSTVHVTKIIRTNMVMFNHENQYDIFYECEVNGVTGYYPAYQMGEDSPLFQ